MCLPSGTLRKHIFLKKCKSAWEFSKTRSGVLYFVHIFQIQNLMKFIKVGPIFGEVRCEWRFSKSTKKTMEDPFYFKR